LRECVELERRGQKFQLFEVYPELRKKSYRALVDHFVRAPFRRDESIEAIYEKSRRLFNVMFAGCSWRERDRRQAVFTKAALMIWVDSDLGFSPPVDVTALDVARFESMISFERFPEIRTVQHWSRRIHAYPEIEEVLDRFSKSLCYDRLSPGNFMTEFPETMKVLSILLDRTLSTDDVYLSLRRKMLMELAHLVKECMINQWIGRLEATPLNQDVATPAADSETRKARTVDAQMQVDVSRVTQDPRSATSKWLNHQRSAFHWLRHSPTYTSRKLQRYLDIEAYKDQWDRICPGDSVTQLRLKSGVMNGVIPLARLSRSPVEAAEPPQGIVPVGVSPRSVSCSVSSLPDAGIREWSPPLMLHASRLASVEHHLGDRRVPDVKREGAEVMSIVDP
jgi:hypothetical protein